MRVAWLWLLATVAILTACTSGQAPVIDRYDASVRSLHTVAAGDTLYSIAWRYGRDFRRLAAINGIGPPYTIYPGQALRLDGPLPASKTTSTSKPASVKPASKPASASAPVSSAAPASPSRPAAVPASTAGNGFRADVWRWPASGALISRFNAGQLSGKGILLAGNEGDPVRAAAPGVVVYRGNRLTGYGNLLIIKHDERWLSAYAHNQRMLVAEGDPVTAGQKIATVGDSGTFRTQLHFEIRRDGKPVDPQSLLPKR